MRCKNCKKKVENTNLLRCPHCGKPLEKKVKKDTPNLILNIAYSAVTILFIVLNFFGFFAPSGSYYIPMMVVALIVIMVVFPFTYGNSEELVKQNIAEIFAIVVPIPFIINWCIFVFADVGNLDRGGIFSAFFIYMLVSMVLPMVLLALKSAHIIKKGNIIAWICFVLSISAGVFTAVFYAIYSPSMQAFNISVLVIQAIIPAYFAFHILIKETVRR